MGDNLNTGRYTSGRSHSFVMGPFVINLPKLTDVQLVANKVWLTGLDPTEDEFMAGNLPTILTLSGLKFEKRDIPRSKPVRRKSWPCARSLAEELPSEGGKAPFLHSSCAPCEIYPEDSISRR